LYGRPSENTANSVIILNTGTKGRTMGLVTITLDDKRVLSVSERRDVSLDRSVPDNGEILGLVEMHKKAQAIKGQAIKNQEIKAQEIKSQKELMGVLQLTPQEFMERYRKELL
jgi:2',3'-cyclic-nucleotide 2'-phosphodiesterase (5'-nucleotidase family)